MTMTTVEAGKQQYTLKVKDTKSGQETIATYGGDPILTTDHETLVLHSAHMADYFGQNRIYTICFVSSTKPI